MTALVIILSVWAIVATFASFGNASDYHRASSLAEKANRLVQKLTRENQELRAEVQRQRNRG